MQRNWTIQSNNTRLTYDAPSTVRTIRRAQSKRNKENQKLLEEKKLQRLKQLQLADYTRIITRLRSHIITCSKAKKKS